jgi:hypothetical protein
VLCRVTHGEPRIAAYSVLAWEVGEQLGGVGSQIQYVGSSVQRVETRIQNLGLDVRNCGLLTVLGLSVASLIPDTLSYKQLYRVSSHYVADQVSRVESNVQDISRR